MLLESGVPSYENDDSTVYDNHIEMNENNNNADTNNEDGRIMRTPIQNFYADQNIFITGGTGFLGKAVIEKLLRTCSDLSTIYLLVRPKRGHNIIDRLDDLFNDPIFDGLKKSSPKFRHKVVAVGGDCENPGLGLSEHDRDLLIQEVSIVFHSAATVRFDEKLRISTAINVGGTLSVLNLCKEMKKLKAMIHVSTAYSNCNLDKIEEVFYPHPFQYEDIRVVANSLSDDAVNDILPRILEKWPNTYTFTKALAEQVVRQRNRDMPIGIFRPGIIISSVEEPLPGWIDNYYGPTGGVAAAAMGILKSVHSDLDAKANLVPVDYTTNALLAAAWDVATSTDRRNDNMLIYNFVSTVESPVTWGEYYKICSETGQQYPILNAKWYISFTPSTNRLTYKLRIFWLHLLPALFIDLFGLCVGQKPRVYKMLTKIIKYLDVVGPFTKREWIYTVDNVNNMWKKLDAKDKQNFKFSFENFNWTKYFGSYMLGVKLYLFKEPLDTLEASRRRAQRLYVLHQIVKFVLVVLAMWILWKIFSLCI